MVFTRAKEIDNVQPVHPAHQGTLQSANILSSPTEALEYTSTMLSRELDNTHLKLKYALKSTSGGRKVTAAAQDASSLVGETMKNAASFTEKTLAGLASGISSNLNVHTESTSESNENASAAPGSLSSMVSQERLAQASTMLSSAGEGSQKLLRSGFSFLSSKFSDLTGTPDKD